MKETAIDSTEVSVNNPMNRSRNQGTKLGSTMSRF
jgi:hypothetical protein